MCGIAGYASLRGPVCRDLLLGMRDSLRHRGPDGEGIWLSADRRLGLVHRRLAVLDLSEAAAQPMASADGRAILTFNGEIYNYLELREELARRGHEFRTASDTEVLLAAYRAWGTACVARLEGMFAFALFDELRKTVFLARDRAGEKPLFYRSGAGVFAFASELKAIAFDPTFSRVIDPAALDRYLAYGYVPADRCIFSAARKLRPAHALEYDLVAGSLREWRYWELPVCEPDPQADARTLLDETEELLQGAVRRQLVADVPVGKSSRSKCTYCIVFNSNIVTFTHINTKITICNIIISKSVL